MTTPAFGIKAIRWTPSLGSALELLDLDAGLWLTVAQGLDELPQQRRAAEVVPFRAGRLRRAALADSRPIVLNGQLFAADNAYSALVDTLKRAFDPMLDPGTLGVTLEDGSERTIAAQPSSIGYGEPLRLAPAVSIELDADPYWRGPAWGASWTLDMGLYMDDGWTLGMATGPFTITPTATPYSASFNPRGTTPTLDAVVQVDGPSTGAISVYNADGVGFTYPALLAAQTLIVDSGARTVTRGGVSVRGSLSLLALNQHGEYFRLRPGADTVTVTGRPAAVRIAFQPTYI